MDERTAYLGFNLVSGIGPSAVDALVNQCGSAANAWHAAPHEWLAAGLNRRAIKTLEHARSTINFTREWQAIKQSNIEVILKSDAAYPVWLHTIHLPPPLLYKRGTIIEQDQWSVAVVGTRAPSLYGQEVAYRLTHELTEAGLTIVSGLAYGIDTIAHTTALKYNGRTLAVLGGGLAEIYPPNNKQLAQQIPENGALISEFAPTLKPVGGNFPARNRIISGLARATLVIEAGQRSGALITARFALEQNRDVLAVPGSILSKTSIGTNQLLAEGASIARSIDDILQVLNITCRPSQSKASRYTPESPAEAILLPLLELAPTHIDELCRTCNLTTSEIMATLGFMEIKGIIRQLSPMVYTLT